MPLTFQEASRFILNQQVEWGAIGVHLTDEGREDASSARDDTLAVLASLSYTLSALVDSGGYLQSYTGEKYNLQHKDVMIAQAFKGAY